jgi:hypothetical protein
LSGCGVEAAPRAASPKRWVRVPSPAPVRTVCSVVGRHVCKTCSGEFESRTVLQWARSDSGSTSGLHPEGGGSIPFASTNSSARFGMKVLASEAGVAGSSPAGPTIVRPPEAQQDARGASTSEAAGSSPARWAICGDVAQLAERLTLTQEVVGSMPAVLAISAKRNRMRAGVLNRRLWVRVPPR